MTDTFPPQFSATPREYQQLSLKRLLNHVWQSSPFYKDFYSSHGIRERDLPELRIQDLPLLTKTILMENFDQAVTDPRLRRSELEQWIQRHPDPKERFSEAFIVIHSSGTSGSLGIFVYSPREWLMADIAIASRLPKPENSSSERTRAAFFAAAHGHFAMVSNAVALDKHRYDTLILSLLDSRELNAKQLNSFQPHRILGYASSVTALAEMALKGELQICPREVFVGGDRLSSAMIRKIRAAWNGLIFDTYGSSESKYIAVKESGDPEMAILDELNIVEVLNDANRPVPSGHEGRVVLTNLYNYTLPLLRYESGDYVVTGATNMDGNATSIREIKGRVNDALPVALRDGVFDTIHPILLSEFHVPGLDRIQFLSNNPEFVELQYIATRNLDSAIRNQFQKLLDAKGAVNTRFDIERRKQIENNPRTGKFDLVKLPLSPQNIGFESNSSGMTVAFQVPNSSRTKAEGSSMGLRIVPDQRCVHQLFEEQSQQTGNAVAVICGNQSLTYSELNARSNQLAHHLRGLGVGAGTLVAICVNRGLDVVIGILGILKAGGAFLPLDPLHPKERKQMVLEDAKASHLLTESSLLAGIPTHSAEIVLLDHSSNSISRRSVADLQNISDPAELAYMMFTSGSTGRPKGVMVTHANLNHYVHAMRIALGVTKTDVYLHTATIGFSSSVRQLFLPLTCGATTLIATIDQIQEPLSLFDTVRMQKVTILDFVPSYWRNCIDSLSALDSPARTSLLKNDVRLILTASEVLFSELPRRWKHEFGQGAQVINMFGQTETTGIVTTYTIPHDDHLDVRTVPIGKPIDSTSVYLLDEEQRLVPVGSVGEIYIAGPGVGRGYLNRTELTAETFLENPFSKGTGRLYRTGDLGRFRPDGNIEFLGRIDDQVKIRGIRIEPGEVTAVLNLCPGLKESVVIAREDELKNRRLVAYLVPSNGTAPPPAELRSFLAEKLPVYLIPSAFIELKALPRLPSGKIDRHALPAPDRDRLNSGQPFVSPRNALERQLIGIWQTVLAVGAISMTDNFFDLGGNSLSAMYLLTHVNKAFGDKLPLAALYQAPTVEEFAKLQYHHEQSVVLTSLLPLQPHGSRPPFFWIHGDSSNSVLPHYLGTDQPVYGLGHQSLDGIPAHFTTVEAIAAHYLEEICSVQRNGPYFMGGYCFGGLVAFEMARILKSRGEEVALLAVIEPSPFRSCGQSSLRDPSDPVPVARRKGLIEESARHLRAMGALGYRQQLAYVGIRVRGVLSQCVRRLTSPVSRRMKSAICAFCIRFGYTLPVNVRSFYILNIYRSARRKYSLRTYSGSIDLFIQEPQYATPTCWDGLSTGTIAIHKIAASDHTAILKEPHFHDWVGKLKAILQKAQEPHIPTSSAHSLSTLIRAAGGSV